MVCADSVERQELKTNEQNSTGTKKTDDLSTFSQRFSYYFYEVTNPLKLFSNSADPDKPWYGRMSSQVPVNCLLVILMLRFSHTTFFNIFWQVCNQTYMSAINYVNRSGSESTKKQIFIAWVFACFPATAIQHFLKLWLESSPLFDAVPEAIMDCLAPFVAVVAANCINVPIMRWKECVEGITLYKSRETSDFVENEICQSKVLAIAVLAKVLTTRILIALVDLVFPNLVLGGGEYFFQEFEDMMEGRNGVPTVQNTIFNTLITTVVVGLSLLFAVPFCLAIWPEVEKIEVEKLPGDCKEKIKVATQAEYVWYNKGL